MTRTGGTKTVDATFSPTRLQIAKAFHAAAASLATSGEDARIGNPAVSLIVSAAIAYGDALSARFAGVVSRAEHGVAAKILRDALGKRLPIAQERAFKRIVDQKTIAQYGSRVVPSTEARALLRDLDNFGQWAEEELRRTI
jgi:hypothetical protein